MKGSLFIVLVVLALAGRTLAGYCANNTCEAGAVVVTSWSNGNCDGEPSGFTSHYLADHTECQTEIGAFHTSVRVNCSASEGLRMTRHRSGVGCASSSSVGSYYAPVGLCLSGNGVSEAIWCNFSDIATPRPKIGNSENASSVPLTVSGSSECPRSGCPAGYSTTFYYTDSTCAGAATKALPTPGQQGWPQLGVCYLNSSSGSGSAFNLMVSCANNTVIYARYSSNCSNVDSLIESKVYKTDICYPAGLNLYKKVTCPSNLNPVSPALPPEASPSPAPAASPSSGSGPASMATPTPTPTSSPWGVIFFFVTLLLAIFAH